MDKKLAVGGIIATVAAGFIGSYVNDYLSRSDPAVFVTSIGFGGPLGDQSIELPDELVSLSAQIDDFPNIKKF